MKHRQVPNILVPAIIGSSAVFALLTLPFFYAQTQLPPGAKASFFGQDLQPILATQNRDLTIRYIGGAMVVSVAIGLSTVELRRYWSRRAFQPPEAAQADAQPDPDLTEFSVESETIHLPPQWLQSGLEHQVSESGSTDRWPTLRTDAAVLELREAGKICRICVYPSQRRLFATEVAGQYYSFFQSVSTREAAWEIAQQLSPAQRQILITPVEQEYAIWVLQPQAEPDLSPVA
jgi:hypothetical protein